MEFDILKSKHGFSENENGFCYKVIGGFVFSVGNGNTVSVSLPPLSRNEKIMIGAYLKNSGHTSVRFVKEGVTFKAKPDTELYDVFLRLASFLSSAGLEFNGEYDIAFNALMAYYIPYVEASQTVIEEIAEEITPVDDADDTIEADAEVLIKEAHCEETACEEAVQQTFTAEVESENAATEKKQFNLIGALKKIPTQIALIVIYAVTGILFFLISLWNIQLAGVVGYFMGWLPAELLVKREYKTSTIYLTALISTLVTVAFVTVYVLLKNFLGQTEIYNAFNYTTQSLTFSHCLFNIVLALLFSLFAIYSTVPAKKKKAKKEPEDF